MILIKDNRTDGIALEHTEFCESYVLNRLEFYLAFFDSICYKTRYKKNKSFKNTFNIDSSSLGYLETKYLGKKYKKKTKSKESRVALFEYFLFQGNRYMLIEDYCEDRKTLTFLKSIKSNLTDILSGDPSFLAKNYTGITSKNEQKKYKELIESLFRYEKLTSTGFVNLKGEVWNSYVLTKKLEVQVCPYCNKNWINTVFDKNGNRVTNPQLDHYFSKSDFPLLRLSFYNLIPSCETCNARIKSSKELVFSDNIHPFVNGFDPHAAIIPIALNSDSSQGKGEEYLICLNLKSGISMDTKDKIKNTFDFFHIKDVYEQHGDIISEIFYKKQKYGMTYLSDLLSDEKFIGMDLNDLYRLVFANYYEIENYRKRPFAKLTKDTVDFLGLM